MSAYTGEISQMNISEGSYVEKGDILFTVKSTDLDLQEEQITGQIDVYTANVEQLKKLEKSVMDGKNYFDLSIYSCDFLKISLVFSVFLQFSFLLLE